VKRISRHPDGIIIAIDGPASSGKSSTAKAVAAELGYRHLDSGAFYRAVTLAALDRGIPAERWSELTDQDLQSFHIIAIPADGGYRLTTAGKEAGDRLRSPEVNANVSRMAAIPGVRDWLLEALRETGRTGGLVADGRDIGTVVFPDAELKIFLVCAPEERAARRLRQEGSRSPSREEIEAETLRLMDRDRLDSARAAAPLAQAPDAVLLDTTRLDFPAQVDAIVRLARQRQATQSLDGLTQHP
jgi:CMP/dCMP kinase